mmetsp:Transcript_17859/g.51137  ORF Transcript_17859/g.51137 Transcript_17859/m.51137 type:complete len:265 (+) Transcript_17859:80-874(+)
MSRTAVCPIQHAASTASIICTVDCIPVATVAVPMLMRGGCIRTGLWSTIDACRCVRYRRGIGRRSLGRYSVLLFTGTYNCGIMILRSAVGVVILVGALVIMGNLSGRVILSFGLVGAGSCSIMIIILRGVISGFSLLLFSGTICRGFIIFHCSGCEIKFVSSMIISVVILRSGGAFRPRCFQPGDSGAAKWTALIRAEPLSYAIQVYSLPTAECGNVGLLGKANDAVPFGCTLSCIASGPRFGFFRHKICLIRLFSPEFRKCSG